MVGIRNLSRRGFVRASLAGAGAAGFTAALAGCGETQIVTERVVEVVTKEVPVEKIVTQIVEKEKIVEKSVEKIVTQIVEKEKIVEKLVTQAAPPQVKRTEIVFWDWWSPAGGPTYEAWFQWAEKAYPKQFPGGSYKFQVIPFGELPVKFQASVASGDVPDVLHFSNAWSWDFFRFGTLMPLNDLVKTRPDLAVDKHFPATSFYAVHNGQLIGMPFEGPDSEITMFNPKMFEDAGLDPAPEAIKKWTWENFDEAAKKLTQRKGAEVDVAGYLVKIPDGRHIAVWMYTQGGKLYTEKRDGFDINNEKGLNVYKHLLRLLYDDKVSLPLVTGRNTLNEYMTSKAAMFQAGTWNIADVDANAPGFPVDVMAYPGHPAAGGQVAVATWMNMLGIPAKATKNLEQAWEFVAWYSEMETSLKRLQLTNKTSTLLAFYDTPEWKVAVNGLPQLQRIVDVAKVGGERPGRALTEVEKTIQPISEAIMLQKKTPEEGLKEMVDAVKSILEKAAVLE